MNTQPAPIPDPDEMPDDMDFDDRARAVEATPAGPSEGAHCFDLDISSAQRPPDDS